MNSEKRWHAAALIRQYLEEKHLTRAEVSARDIVNFHGLPHGQSISISALLKQVFASNVKSNKYGFRVTNRRSSKSARYPNRYIITLVKSV